MKNLGLLKIAAGLPEIKIASPLKNAAEIISISKQAASEGASIIFFPALSSCGATASDLILQPALMEASNRALLEIAKAGYSMRNLLIIVGAPLQVGSEIVSAAVYIQNGSLIAAQGKNILSFEEARIFSPASSLIDRKGKDGVLEIEISGQKLFLTNGTVSCCLSGGVNLDDLFNFSMACEFSEEIFFLPSVSQKKALESASLVFNLASFPELSGSGSKLRSAVNYRSETLGTAYFLCSSGPGESSTDFSFGGRRMLSVCGKPVCEKGSFEFRDKILSSVIDLEEISVFKAKKARASAAENTRDKNEKGFPEIVLPRHIRSNGRDLIKELRISPLPFVPVGESEAEVEAESENMLETAAAGLSQRLKHIGCRNVVLGISGGLDSTLALITCVRAFKNLGLPAEGIHALTLPGPGTSSMTHKSAISLMEIFGCSTKEINISQAVKAHLKDIGHEDEKADIAYQNAQARERTQILMDYANMTGGIVVGTGDMSEAAVGWCTYNGDHMSMYNVNAGIPKTLVRHLVAFTAKKYEELADSLVDEYAANKAEHEKAAAAALCLRAVLDTPVSPELLPTSEKGEISQKSEDSTGPYVLNDFFLYHFCENHFGPEKIFELCREAFYSFYKSGGNELLLDRGLRVKPYRDFEILTYMENFFKRFFSQQFKRSCSPDGPAVVQVSLSPRTGSRLVSDVSSEIWVEEIRELKKKIMNLTHVAKR